MNEPPTSSPTPVPSSTTQRSSSQSTRIIPVPLLRKPDILYVVQAHGIDLKQRGKDFWGLCPFHSEGTPSFSVSRERQQFYCFGCHRGGDVITFVQMLKGLTFSKALAYLGIERGTPSRETARHIRRERKKRVLIDCYHQWLRDYHSDLCSRYRALQKAKEKVRTLKDLKLISSLYHRESTWLGHMEIIEGSDEEAKLEIYQEVLSHGRVL